MANGVTFQEFFEASKKAHLKNKVINHYYIRLSAFSINK